MMACRQPVRYTMVIGGEALHHPTPDMTAATFQVGSTYSGRFIGNADAVFQVTILKRTAKQVTIADPIDGKTVKTCAISTDHEGGELIRPFGSFSMAPVCRAKRLVTA